MIKFTAQPGRRDELAAHLAQVAREAQQEPETELFVVYTSPTDPNAVWMLETYSSAVGLEAHNAAASNVAAKAKTGEFLAGPPEVLPLEPLVGKGLL